MTPTLKRRYYFTPEEVEALRYPGIWFHSAFEKMVFHIHKLAEAEGEIEDVVSQPASVRVGAGRHFFKTDIRFRLAGGGEFIWVEAKGMGSRHWARNLQDWKVSGPGLLMIWSGSAMRPSHYKTIVPEGVEHGQEQ